MEQPMKKRKGLSGEDRYRLIADFTYDWEYWRNPGLRVPLERSGDS